MGGIEDREVVLSLTEGADAVVNFAAESHVDRSITDQNAFARTHVTGTGVLLDAVRERGVPATCRSPPTRSTARSPRAPSPRPRRWTRPLPTQPRRRAATCWCPPTRTPTVWRGDLPRLEQLRPAPVSGEADPALRAERAARGLAAGLRRRPPGTQLALRGGLCRAIHEVLLRGRPGQAYNAGGPDECENLEVVRRILELTGRDDSLIEYVQDRPGHDRRYSLASDKLRDELGWEARWASRKGSPARSTGPRQRGLVGAIRWVSTGSTTSGSTDGLCRRGGGGGGAGGPAAPRDHGSRPANPAARGFNTLRPI